MSVLASEPAFLKRYIRTLRGSSVPILAEASDGFTYVVKFMKNPQGQNVPFNESMGTELYRVAGLPVPVWRPLLLSHDFLAGNLPCALQIRNRHRRSGKAFSFGCRYLGSDETRLFEILPRTRFSQIRDRGMFWLAWVLDVCACHTDNRQCIFERNIDGTYGTYFIDHGHMFGGPKGNQEGHQIAPRYLDRRIYECLSSSLAGEVCGAAGKIDVNFLWNEMETLPGDWKTDSARRRFRECLDHLSDQRFVDATMDRIVEASHGIENEALPQQRCDEVLRSCVRFTDASSVGCKRIHDIGRVSLW